MNKPTNKPPAQLTDDELFLLLKEANTEAPSPVKTDIKSIHGDVYLFIARFQLNPGESPVSINLIWQLYREWSKSRLAKAKLVNILKHLFPHTKDCFLLNKEMFLVSEELENYLITKVKFKINSDRENKHFTNFLKKHIINDGKEWIDTSTLFQAYKTWVKEIRKSNTLGFEQFNQFCKTYFKFSEQSTLTKVAIDIESVKWPKTKSGAPPKK